VKNVASHKVLLKLYGAFRNRTASRVADRLCNASISKNFNDKTSMRRFDFFWHKFGNVRRRSISHSENFLDNEPRFHVPDTNSIKGEMLRHTVYYLIYTEHFVIDQRVELLTDYAMLRFQKTSIRRFDFFLHKFGNTVTDHFSQKIFWITSPNFVLPILTRSKEKWTISRGIPAAMYRYKAIAFSHDANQILPHNQRAIG